MYITQKGLLEGMSDEFVKELMNCEKVEAYREGDRIFKEKDPAGNLYVLQSGRVKLCRGDKGYVIYIVDKIGEIFGWSSLMGREVYTASGICMEPTELISIDKISIQKLHEKHPADGLLFFKKVAEILGERLVYSYEIIHLLSMAGTPES